MAHSLAASRLGKYEIQAEIGRGGMGTVYRAHDPLLDRQVAIKVLAPHLVWEQGFVERFLREARAAARLKHPCIVAIHDVGREGDSYYFVMEYLAGQSLTELIRQQGALPPDRALSILGPLAQALDYAHQQGLVHRDIKPGNIIVSPAGQVTLTDFGIAKAAEETRLTTTGTIVGTPEYMSPEQARGEDVDLRTDIYSVGVVAYEMLSGRTPFGGVTPHAVLHMQIYEPPPPIRQVRPDLPAEVETVLDRALAKEPGKRYVTVTALVEALSQALAGKAVERPEAEPPTVSAARAAAVPLRTGPPPPKQPAPPAAAPAPKPVPRARAGPSRGRLPGWIWVLGGVAAVVLVAGVVALALSGGGVESTSPPPPGLANQPTATTLPADKPAPSDTAPAAATPRPVESRFECTDPLGCVHIRPKAPIPIGFLFALSGPMTWLGEDTRRGLEIAAEDQGQVLGHAIELIGEDTLCTPEGGFRAAQRLAAAPELVAVVGTNCSIAAWEATPILCDIGLPMISPSAAAPDLTGPQRPDHHFCFLRTVWSDSMQGIAAARFARDSGVERAATLHDGSPHVIQVQQAFAREFKRLGGTITAQEPIELPEAGAMLGHIASTEPELIFYPVLLEVGGPLTRQVRETPGLEHTRLMAADGLFSPELLEIAGEAAMGMFLTIPDPPAFSRDYERFLGRYEDKYGEPPPDVFHAYAYDAAMMVFAAVEKVAVKDPDGALHVGRQALLEALFATKGFAGLTGSLTCNEHGDCAEIHMAVYEVVSAEPDSWNPGAGPDNNPRRIWP